MIESLSRHCPQCNIELLYNRIDHIVGANRRNSKCKRCSHLGRPVSETAREKIRQFNLGRKHTEETKKKISEHGHWPRTEEMKRFLTSFNINRPPARLGAILTPETKRKQRVAALARIEANCGQVNPNYNTYACNLFEQINNTLGWNGQHAENGGEYRIKELGYFVDYYEPMHNIIIEYDEKPHNQPKKKAKDIQREKEITELLKCTFYRLNKNDTQIDQITQRLLNGNSPSKLL